MIPERQEGESASAYYQRLVALRGELYLAIRAAKAEASDEVNEAELRRRFERDLAKAKEDASGEARTPE